MRLLSNFASLAVVPAIMSAFAGALLTLVGSLNLLFDCPKPLAKANRSYKLWVAGGLLMPMLLLSFYVFGSFSELINWLPEQAESKTSL